MSDAVERAARFIRRGDYVHANAVLKYECAVEYVNPAQRGYCCFDPEDLIGGALENVARLLDCLTYTEGDTFLTVVGEKEAIDALEEVRRVALSDEYGYKDALNKAVSGADIEGIGEKQFKKWCEDYIQGFFDGLIGNADLGWFGAFSKQPHVLGILDGIDSAKRYVKDKENK